MRIAGSIAIIVVILALAFYSYFGSAGSVAVGQLDVEILFATVGLPFSDDLRADATRYREMFASQGFMAIYRECYTVALDSQRFDFARQLVAVCSLLVISRYEVDSETMRSSAMRLFINFCRLSLVEKISAVQLNRVVEEYGLFSGNPELEKLWSEYLQHVWVREVRPRIRRYGTIDENDQKFIKLREHFAAETLALINKSGKSL